MKADGRRDLQPDLAKGHAGRHIRAANAGGKSAQCPVSTGMGIGADYQIPRPDQPLFREETVLNPHLADLKIMDDPVFLREFPHHLCLLRRFDILVWGKMVRDQGDRLRIKDLIHPNPGKLLNRHRRRNIIAQHQVYPGVDQFPRFYLLLSGMRRQDLFCYCHCHHPHLPFLHVLQPRVFLIL